MAKTKITKEKIERIESSIVKSTRISRQIVTVIVLLFVLFFVGTFSYVLIKRVNLDDGLIFTLETLAFMRNPESGALRVIQLFLMLFGVFIMWWVLWWIFDLFLEGRLGEYIKDIKFLENLKKMENHYIICGGGRVGGYIALTLAESKQKCVVIENDENTANELRKKGVNVFIGDATDEQVLIQNGIKKARALVSVVLESEKNILITLTAKELNSGILVYARVHKRELVSRIKRAGANFVIVPEVAGAERIVQQIFR